MDAVLDEMKVATHLNAAALTKAKKRIMPCLR